MEFELSQSSKMDIESTDYFPSKPNHVGRSWIELTDSSGSVPSKRRSHSSFVWGNKMFIFGGYAPSKHCLNDLIYYDFELEIWKKVVCESDLPEVRSNHTIVAHRNYAYLFGGWNINYRISDFHKFNLETHQWEIIKNFTGEIPCARSNHTCVVYKNSLWIFGGYLSGRCFNDFFEYNILQNSWQKITSIGTIPQERHSHSCVVYGNSMWVFGGCHFEERRNDLWEFSFESRTWNRVQTNGPVPKPRSSHSVVVYNKVMLVLGGRFSDHVLPDLWAFDFETKTWRQIENLDNVPCGRSSHSAVVYKNALYVFGGCPSWNQYNSYLNDFHKLDLKRALKPSSGSLSDDLTALIERQFLTDICFRIGNESIFAHQAIVAARSTVLKKLIDEQLKLKTHSIFEVNLSSSAFSASSFRALLSYIYSDKVNLEEKDFQFVLGLYRLGIHFELPRCAAFCESEIRSRVNEETVLEILLSVKSIPSLKAFAIHYFIENEAILVEKNIQILGSDTLSEIYRLRLSRLKIEPIFIPPSTLSYDIGTLLKSGDMYSDCVCSVNNTKFSTHKCILASRSPYFEAAFASQFRESISGEITIVDFPSPSAFSSLLEFIYTGSMQYVDPRDSVYIIPAISYFGLEEKNVQLDIDETNALYIFETADIASLREKALRVIIQKFHLISQDPHIFEMKAQSLAEIISAVGSSSQHQVN